MSPASAPGYRYPRTAIPVRFRARPNKYRAEVESLETGARFSAHVPNPGRMLELLEPGRTRGFAIPVERPGRCTPADLVAVRHRRTLVSIDSRVANRVVGAALRSGALSSFGPGPWTAEPRLGHHRLDFGRLAGGGAPAALLEVKSSNLVRGRVAMFPDAPTVRGTAHLELLGLQQQRGVRCGVLFVVQRNDVDRFSPNVGMDPAFADALARAHRAGVRVEARTLEVGPERVGWGRSIPVDPSPPAERF